MKEKVRAIIQWVRALIRKKLHYQNEDLPYYLTIIICMAIFITGLKVFIELADELAENELGNFDETVSSFIVSFRSPELNAFFRFVTDLGDRYAYLIIIAILAAVFWFRFKNWKPTLQIVAVLLLASASNILLKQYINRSRPSLDHLVTVNTLSFPSGHSMSAAAFYGFIVYLVLTMQINKWMKLTLSALLILLIILIGVSRIYLGVHYPSDVAAGFAGGLLWVALCAIVLNITALWMQRKKTKRDAV